MKLLIGRRWMLTMMAIVMTGMVALPLAAQMKSSLSFRRYTPQDGLPQIQAERVWQDSRGYIYIGTLSGLVRFDGKTFTPFLKGKRYNIVGFAEVDGQVWALDFRQRWRVGLDEIEMQKLDDEGKWLLNNFNSGDLPNRMVLMEDEEEANRWIGRMEAPSGGVLWLGKNRDKVNIRRVMAHPLLDKMTPDRRLYVDSTWVYIPTEQGLHRVKKGSDVAVRLSENDSFYALCRKGKTLYAFAQDGIYTVEDDSVIMHTPFDEWQAGYGLIVKATKTEVLIADEHSLYSFNGQSVSKLHGGANLIKDMLIDRWGRLWVATYQGVYCFFGRHFTNYQLSDENDIVRAVGVGEDGHIVMGTLNGKIESRIPPLYRDEEGDPATRIRTAQPLTLTLYDDPDNFFCPSTAQIGRGTYLAGRNDVARVNGNSVEWLGLPFERYQHVSEANERLILVTRQVIAAYDPKTERVDSLSTEVPHPWCAAADGEGRLWVGSTFGLFCIQDSTNHLLSTGDHRLSTTRYDYPQKLIITTMEADTHGAVFFASGDSLFLIRKGEVTELSSQMPELAGHEVRSLHVSPRGFLVVAAIDGLFVCRMSEDYRLSQVVFFDHTNGFTIIEPLKTRMAEEEDGTVWLCGVEEMTSFKPEALIADSQADTFISPPPAWWQHWWVGLLAVAILAGAVWALTRWYEKRRARRKLARLQREKHEKEQLIRAIREEAMKAEKTELAEDIVKMTEKEIPKQLALRSINGMIMVTAADIVYLKADGNYTQLVTFEGSEFILAGLGTVSKMLDEHIFIRADRSTMVNISYIRRLNTMGRTCTFRSPDGKELETSLLTPAFKRIKEELEMLERSEDA